MGDRRPCEIAPPETRRPHPNPPRLATHDVMPQTLAATRLAASRRAANERIVTATTATRVDLSPSTPCASTMSLPPPYASTAGWGDRSGDIYANDFAWAAYAAHAADITDAEAFDFTLHEESAESRLARLRKIYQDEMEKHGITAASCLKINRWCTFIIAFIVLSGIITEGIMTAMSSNRILISFANTLCLALIGLIVAGNHYFEFQGRAQQHRQVRDGCRRVVSIIDEAVGYCARDQIPAAMYYVSRELHRNADELAWLPIMTGKLGTMPQLQKSM